jgi:hypothetical protein
MTSDSLAPDEAPSGVTGRGALRMELVEFLGSQLSGEAAHDLFELASADPAIFFAELMSRHKSGQLVLPPHLAKAVSRDLHHR